MTDAKRKVPCPMGSPGVAPLVESFAKMRLRATAQSIPVISYRGKLQIGAESNCNSCKAMPEQRGGALGEPRPFNAVHVFTEAVDTGPKALVSKVGVPRGIGQKALVLDQALGICGFASLVMCLAHGPVVELKISLVKVVFSDSTDFDDLADGLRMNTLKI